MRNWALMGLLTLALPVTARAVEIYGDGSDVVTYVSTPRFHYHYHAVEPVVVDRYHVDVDVAVRNPTPPRDPFDELGLIEIGAGYGGFYMPSLRESLLDAPRAHLALILDPVSVNLDVSVARNLEWGTLDPARGCCLADEGPCGSGDLVQTSLGFAWRWNRRGHLHPTAGAALEMASLSPDTGDATFAFTAAASAGLIFEYPLPYGALEAGVDATGHVLLVSQDAYPLQDPLYLTFGGYVGYRF
jgi:hypothetical protein